MKNLSKNENELISIIIPAYNAEEYLSDCIESVLKQTYLNIEIIIVNDGSRDNTIKIIRKYEKIDKRIIVINQKILYNVSKDKSSWIWKAVIAGAGVIALFILVLIIDRIRVFRASERNKRSRKKNTRK
mgnify:CR=1 FL=1